tara:strand:- start:14865 stop:15794 length:930 start_codon:yes stop_codon:yes gene_type:complete
MSEETTTADIPVKESSNSTGVPNFFSPLDEPMKERSYSRPESIDTGEIEEPTFQGGLNMEDLQGGDPEMEQEENKPFDNITNEGVNQLDNKDKKIACKQLVETSLEVYKMLHQVGQRFAKKDEQEIMQAVQNGDIDAEMEIPIDEKGTTTNPIEFFQNYNEQVEEALSYDEEFGEKVRPAMERVFEKRGWGMNDEQYLMYMFGKDIAMKGMMVVTLKKQANMIFNTFVELKQQKFEQMRKENVEVVKPDSIETEPKPNIDVDEPIVENQSDMEEVFEDVEIKEEKPKAKRKGRPKKSKAKLDAEESITG